MEINGIAHIYLTVANFDECLPFYRRLLPFLGLTRVVIDDKNNFYCIGARTGVGIMRCEPSARNMPFRQGRAGLHHICFRARSNEDVDAVYQLVRELGATIVHPPEVGRWAPGYYSVLFEDPDGIRLEVNYVPGHGLLKEEARKD